MPKKYEKNETEYLRGRVKKLEKERKKLLRLVKHYEQRKHQYEDNTYEDDEETDEDTILSQCPSCGKGVLEVADIKFFIIKKCTQCDYQEKKKTY